MKAFVGFIWSQNSDYSAWSWNLNKQKLIEWVQSEYAIASVKKVNEVCFSKLFNNLSDIKKYKETISGNELKAVNEFLKFVADCETQFKGYFIDNQPHDK